MHGIVAGLISQLRLLHQRQSGEQAHVIKLSTRKQAHVIKLSTRKQAHVVKLSTRKQAQRPNSWSHNYVGLHTMTNPYCSCTVTVCLSISSLILKGLVRFVRHSVTSDYVTAFVLSSSLRQCNNNNAINVAVSLSLVSAILWRQSPTLARPSTSARTCGIACTTSAGDMP